MLTGAQVAEIRKQRGWSQQHLAILSGVNKAYISEYESGVRAELPPHMLERLGAALIEEPAGRTSPSIERRDERPRLVLRDAVGNEYLPKAASVQWTEDDGTTYSIYLGAVAPD